MTPRVMRGLARTIYLMPVLWFIFIARTWGPPALGVLFGGFAVGVAVLTVVVPTILQRIGQPVLAERWRLAALSGLDFPALWLFFWPAILLRVWPLGLQLVLALVFVVASALAYVWASRRWNLDRRA